MSVFREIRSIERRPERLERARARRRGQRVFAHPDGFEASITEEVVERLETKGRQSAPNEWYGVLVGRRYQDELGPHAVVLAVVFDRFAEVSPDHFRTTEDSEFRLQELIRDQYPDLESIGPVHGHVKIGTKYSDPDRENQATWPNKNTVGAVVDPWSTPTITMYRGPSSTLLTEVLSTARLRRSKLERDGVSDRIERKRRTGAVHGEVAVRLGRFGAILATAMFVAGMAAPIVLGGTLWSRMQLNEAHVSALTRSVEELSESPGQQECLVEGEAEDP